MFACDDVVTGQALVHVVRADPLDARPRSLPPMTWPRWLCRPPHVLVVLDFLTAEAP